MTRASRLGLERLEDRCLLRYSGPLPIDAGPSPSFVAAADFNGDGHSDLAVVNQTQPGGVCVLLGNDDGTFQPAVEYEAGADASTLVAVDLNGDSKLDLAVSEQADGTLSIRIGNGDGTFQAAQRFDAGPRANRLVAADFNVDGRVDLAVVNDGGVAGHPGQHGISVLLGQAGGTFNTLAPLAIGFSPVNVAVADLDEDGVPDLAAAQAHFDKVVVLHGAGDGTFQLGRSFAVGASPQGLTAADLNRDGHVDLVAANEFNVDASVLLGLGDGSFQPLRTFTPDPGSDYHAVVVEDFDRDGRLDLALAGCPGFVLVLHGDGTGAFPTFTRLAAHLEAMSLTTGDFNGDGLLDLVSSSPASNVTALLLTLAETSTSMGFFSQQTAAGTEVTLTAAVRAEDNTMPTGKLQFLEGSTVLATVTLVNGSATFTTSTLAPGQHTVRAAYCGTANFADSQSDPVILSFNQTSSPEPVPPPPVVVTPPVVVNPTPNPTVLHPLFVAQTYRDLLGREPDLGGLSNWTVRLGAGLSSADFVRAIATSLEYRTNQVQDVYQRLLRRTADPTGLRVFSAFLITGTQEQLSALVAGSPEFLQSRGGGSSDGFLAALYQDGLGRGVDAFGLASFRRAFSNGASRQQVADAVFASDEFRQRLVRGFYQRFLQREADAGGLRNHVNRLAQGQRQEQVIVSFLTSDEHLLRL